MIILQCLTGLGLLAAITLYLLLFAEPGGSDADKNPGRIAGKLWSSLYGSVLAIASTILSARSVRRASNDVTGNSNAAMAPIFSGLLNKLLIVGGGIAIGLITLGLEPINVVSGYLVVQLVSVWGIVKPGVNG